MNILIFGPNGSGKGTQGAVIQKKFGVPHIETGVIFRENIARGTELGNKAKSYIDRGELVPDEITIPMILNRLKEDDAKNGWLLDGFPRNLAQAKALYEALQKDNMKLDYVVEIVLDRDTAKKRIMAGGSAPSTTTTQTTSTSTPSNRAGKAEGPAIAKALESTKNLKLNHATLTIDPKTHNPLKKAGVILRVGDDLKAKFYKKVQTEIK